MIAYDRAKRVAVGAAAFRLSSTDARSAFDDLVVEVVGHHNGS